MPYEKPGVNRSFRISFARNCVREGLLPQGNKNQTAEPASTAADEVHDSKIRAIHLCVTVTATGRIAQGVPYTATVSALLCFFFIWALIMPDSSTRAI